MLILIISSKTHHSEYIFIPHQMNKVSLSKQADLELRSLQKVRFSDSAVSFLSIRNEWVCRFNREVIQHL